MNVRTLAMQRTIGTRWLFVLLVTMLAARTNVAVRAADWLLTRGDAERSGYSAESLPAKLALD